MYLNGRCALHHSASTDGNVTVGVSGEVLQFSQPNLIRINRTGFHEELKKTFAAYLQELTEVDKVELRRNLKTKMDAICSLPA